MKKKFLLIILLSFLLTSCGSISDNNMSNLPSETLLESSNSLENSNPNIYPSSTNEIISSNVNENKVIKLFI